MSGKVLFCATVDYHFKAFHLPVLNWFKEQGWEVHAASKGSMDLPFVDKKYDIPIERSPIKLENRKAYLRLKAIMDENKYDIVHCHTPMGGVLARLAARKSREWYRTKLIYTAHGFHFCKGAPLLNWLIYYPIEKYLSFFTDCLITINQEDHQLALNHRFKAGRIARVHGVGVNTERYIPVNDQLRQELRIKLGYKPDDFLLFYAAEFNKNKNQQLLIRALALIKEEAPQARLLLAGSGSLLDSCRELAEQHNVAQMVDFLGYRNDIASLLSICDVAVASSLREGLPVNIMEAMACGLPVVATHNRGHSELIEDEVNGFIIRNQNIGLFAAKLLELSRSLQLRNTFRQNNFMKINQYSIAQVGTELSEIYMHYMLEDTDEAEGKYSRAYI